MPQRRIGAIVDLITNQIISGLKTFSKAVTLTDTTPSTSTTTGALLVSGGTGIAGNLNVGGTVSQSGIKKSIGSTVPTSPATGDQWDELDGSNNLVMEWGYHSSGNWLSRKLFKSDNFGNGAFANNYNTASFSTKISSTGNLYIVSYAGTISVATTNDASNYWTPQIQVYPSTGSSVMLGGSNFSTSGYSPSTNTYFYNTLNTFVNLTSTDMKLLGHAANKTGTPGNLTIFSTLEYRLAR